MSLDKRQQEMLERKNAQKAHEKKAERVRKRIAGLAGPGAEVRVEVIRPGEDQTPEEIRDVIGRLKLALRALDGLSPEEIHEKVTALTQVLHIKLQLQVNTCIDRLNSGDPIVRKDALDTVKALMPFITQITELDVKMQAVLGINESKNKLVGVQRRQNALPAPSADAWEKSFGDTLTNKSVN